MCLPSMLEVCRVCIRKIFLKSEYVEVFWRKLKVVNEVGPKITQPKNITTNVGNIFIFQHNPIFFQNFKNYPTLIAKYGDSIPIHCSDCSFVSVVKWWTHVSFLMINRHHTLGWNISFKLLNPSCAKFSQINTWCIELFEMRMSLASSTNTNY